MSYLLVVDCDFPPELHDHLDWAPPAHEGREGAAHRASASPPRPARSSCPSSACTWRRAWTARGSANCTGPTASCSPFMAGFMELKHSERRQLKTAGSVVAEKVVKLLSSAAAA